MNIILKYNRYLKQVYPTEALISFGDTKKISFTLTKDSQIKQEFTGGDKNHIKDNNDKYMLNVPPKSKLGAQHIKPIEVNNAPEIEKPQENRKKVSKSGNLPYKLVYISSANDSKTKRYLFSFLKSKYGKDGRILVTQNYKPSENYEGIGLIIALGNNYTFKNDKLQLDTPNTDHLFFIPDDNTNEDYAKSIFIAGNKYIHSNTKVIDYFDRKKEKSIKKDNTKIIDDYLKSKINQLENLYQRKHYIEITASKKELFNVVDTLVNELPVVEENVYPY